MKKTTYIMIGLALGGLLLLMGVLTYVFTCTGYEFNREILIEGPMTSRTLPHFNRVIIQNKSSVDFGLADDCGGIIIEQSDTAKEARLTSSEGWGDMLLTEVSGDTLFLTLKLSAPGESNHRTWSTLQASDPILLAVPASVTEFQNRTHHFTLNLSHFNDASVFVSSLTSVSVYDSNFRSYVHFGGYEWYNKRRYGKTYLNLHSSKVDSFVSFEEVRDYGVGMDSISAINNFTWISAEDPGVDDINLIDCRVNSFSWIKNNPSRTLSLKADASLAAEIN